jgi:hypothetical protein
VATSGGQLAIMAGVAEVEVVVAIRSGRPCASLTVSSGRITRVDLIRAPGKLPRLGARPRRVALRAGDDVFCRPRTRLA